jgi:hypothetical protein
VDYLQRCIDLRRQDIEPEIFTISLAVRYIRELINHGGSDMRRPDLESALHPEHLESFLARAVEIPWKDSRLAQEWRKLQRAFPRVGEAWEKGQRLFQEALERTKSDQKSMQYFSMIDFAVDCYAEVAASRIYPDHPALRTWAINGYMLACREHFLKDQEGGGAHGKELLITYYFEVLPLHPQPENLESLTSYLMRLAEHNGISSIDGISALCFPHQDRRITRDIADYPPVSFGDLVIAADCTEETLRTTTFFHLAAKFGRATLPQPTSRFLSGCVGQYLRYCPVCIAEQPVRYYLLSWRFLMVTCCRKHQCRLLETCGHCGEFIPLFTSPFTVGNCPRCRFDLKLCAAVPESDEGKLEASTQAYNDLVFLLTPQPWEADSTSVIKWVGRRLAHIRHMKQRTAVEVARQIGVTLTIVEGIERGNFQGRGATLQSYFKYAHYLCLSLNEVFSAALDAPDHVPATPLPHCPACQQSCYVTRYGYNRSGSQRYQCHQCHRSFTASPKAREVKRGSRLKSVEKVAFHSKH